MFLQVPFPPGGISDDKNFQSRFSPCPKPKIVQWCVKCWMQSLIPRSIQVHMVYTGIFEMYTMYSSGRHTQMYNCMQQCNIYCFSICYHNVLFVLFVLMLCPLWFIIHPCLYLRAHLPNTPATFFF